VDKDLGRQALASALSFFARSTGSEIVAEGIESHSEFATLPTLGVTKGQGYLLGRPADLHVARELAGSTPTAPAPA
jgi:EAL domain-containing protein (putative c-di-GMP-specific phosphodiesterase class I)